MLRPRVFIDPTLLHVRLRVLFVTVACAGAGVSAPALVPYPAPPSLEIHAGGAGASVEGPVLALTWLDAERLVVLAPDALRVYRWRDGDVARISERLLPEAEPVRFRGGLLLAGEDAVWVLYSGSRGALLFALDAAGTISERAQAEAMPWPGCPRGLRYRDGTNLLAGAVEGLGEGPFLALADGLAVDEEARVLLATPGGPRASPLRAGPALVALGGGLFAAASASPPGPSDTILLLERDGDELRLLDEVAVSGPVRALSGGRGDGAAPLLAAVESGDGVRLLPLVVRRARP